MIKEENIIIRRAYENDAVEITRLLERLGLLMPQGDEILKHWNRIWKQNPYYKLFPDELHCGWIMEHEGKVVGVFASFPRSCYLNGKPFRLSIASQWGVEKEFRKYTALLSDKFFHHDPIKTRLVTTAIKPTGVIFEKYGGLKVPSVNLLDVYMVPFRLDKLVMVKLNSKIKKPLLNSIAQKVLTVFSLPWHWHYKLIRTSGNISEINPSELGEDYEIFWNSYLKSSHGLLASRNADNIKWAYQGGFRKLENKLFIYRKNDKVLGYGSILKEPIKDSELNRYKIVDLLALDPEVKRDLVKFMISYCYQANADVLEVPLPGLLVKDDIPVLTLTRQIPVWPYYFQTTEDEVKAVLSHADNWQTSPFDGDACLF